MKILPSLARFSRPALFTAAILILGGGGMLQAGSVSDSPASLAVLLGLDGVRQELQISPAQCGLLDALQADYKKEAKNIMAIGQADQDAALRADWDAAS
ncbi:MAG: hypothetical protein WCI42_02800 [Verrucomicrobiota bacterium]